MRGSNKSENQKEKTTQLSITPTAAVVAAHITPHSVTVHHSKVHPPHAAGWRTKTLLSFVFS